MKYILIIWILFTASACLAQSPYMSKLGRFQVDQIKGCAPLTITLTNLLPGGCGIRPCAIDFNANIDDIDDATASPSNFTYTTPGTYTIKVIYQNQDNQIDNLDIVVVANTPPAFDLYACSGNGVQVKVTDTKYDQYLISYSDGASLVVPAGSLAKDNHIFATAGAKTINVKGRNVNAADNCTTASLPFSAAATLPVPAFTSVTQLSATDTELTYTLNSTLLGRIEIATNNNATFQQLKSVYKDSRDTITSLSNESAYYCYRLGVVDACSNTVGSYTTPVCSIVLTATAKDGFNQLDWKNNPANIVSYSVSRDNQANFSTGIAPIAVSFNDLNVTCNTAYCYQVKALYAGASSTSLIKCATSFTTQKPPAVTNLLATIDNQDQVQLSWTDQPEALEYAVFKMTSGNPYVLVAQQAEPSYTDKELDTNAPPCYEIIYKDQCNNTSPTSAEACPVILTASLSSDNIVNLTWTSYTGWQNGVAGYRVERYTQSSTLLNVYDVGLTNTFTDDDSKDDLFNQVAYYRIVALANQAGIGPSTSNRVLVVKRPNLFYPSSFTPNGDNLNDKFKVFGQYIAQIDMKIFNRWGELVFTTDKIQDGWDGSYKGNLQPEGTYAFIAEITDFAGRKVNETGSIVLLKKNKE